jgi:hypothetical protein
LGADIDVEGDPSDSSDGENEDELMSDEDVVEGEDNSSKLTQSEKNKMTRDRMLENVVTMLQKEFNLLKVVALNASDSTILANHGKFISEDSKRAGLAIFSE